MLINLQMMDFYGLNQKDLINILKNQYYHYFMRQDLILVYQLLLKIVHKIQI